MTTARIIERGEKIVKNKNRYNEVITCLKSSEDKVNVDINDRFFETINIPGNFKELVKISYGYVDSEYGYVDKEDVYAFCEDKSYYDLLEP